MDGSASGFPSSSVASVATVNLRSRRSAKDSFKSAPATPNTYLDPPRPARAGYEWVWFPAGYWAEREIVENPGRVMKHFMWRKRSGKSSSSRDTIDDLERSLNSFSEHASKTPQLLSSVPLTEEARSHSPKRPLSNRHGTSSESSKSAFPLNRTQSPLPSPYLTEEAHVQSLQRSPLGYRISEYDPSLPRPVGLAQSPPLTVIDSDSATPLAMSLDRTGSTPGFTKSPSPFSSPTTPEARPKKSFIARLFSDRKPKTKKTHSDNDVYDYTANTAAGAQAQIQDHRSSQSPTPLISRVASLLREEGKKPRSLRLFGKSPWHRKASAGSEVSASSSVRDVLRGRTPVASPVSYIEPSNSYCIQFPGGEATRVQTPPLRETRHPAGRPRSFFFDISAPPTPAPAPAPAHRRSNSDISSEPCASPSRLAAASRSSRRPDGGGLEGGSDKEWWEVPVAVTRYDAAAACGAAEYDVPEHLPSSPMCPANKRHKSGGTGVCKYHGRRKRSRAGADSDDDDDDEGDRADDEERDLWT